jgi:hypothetical protein
MFKDMRHVNIKVYILAIIVAALVFGGCRKPRNYDRARLTGDVFQVSGESYGEKTPVFYSYTDSAKEIYFFVVKVNGRMYSYFDICNSCRHHSQGYRANETFFLECRDCQVAIPYEDLKTGIGGCYPHNLPGKEENGMYSITRSEIVRGRQFFP